MGHLSHLIDPRFLHPLATALSSSPQTDLDLSTKFARAVPNRNISQRSLHILLDLAMRAGLVCFENKTWRSFKPTEIEKAVVSCIANWARPQFVDDDLFRHRCAVCLDQGMLSASAEYTSLQELACRSTLTPTEWSRLISGPQDLRVLTGWASKHTEADFLMLYRSSDTAPITDDTDVLPRIPCSLLPQLPTGTADLLAGIRAARTAWRQQVHVFLGESHGADLASFIVYAKEMLDMLLWGASSPLRSLVSTEQLTKTSQTLSRFGLRSGDLATIWRALPSVYRIISRLSWGVRYLSNNLSHPQPPEPSLEAFLGICRLPLAKQSAISASRAGHSLLTIVRPLKVLHRALATWKDRAEVAKAARECSDALDADMHKDKLLRREFAERIKRLNVTSPVYILDALAQEIPAPSFHEYADDVLTSAGLISGFSRFFESSQGRAYSELRLALHADLDFQRRFNAHASTAPKRYAGIWRCTIQELVTRLEDTRKSPIPGRLHTH